MCVFEVSEIINAVTSVVQTVAKVQEIRIEKAESEYNAQVMVSKAKTAENQAAYERQNGIETARKQRLNAILAAADTKADIASGNLGVSSMTSLNLVNDDLQEGQNQSNQTLKLAEHKASNYIGAANDYYRDSAFSLSKAKHIFFNDLFRSTAEGSLNASNALWGD